MNRFTVTEQHLKLLREANVDWNDMETGAPGIDPKRPYGNSWVAGDIARILGIKHEGDMSEEMEREMERALMEVHHETLDALQIALCTGKFEAGVYEQTREHDYSSWRKVG